MLHPPWHIITGEYACGLGGVADYSRSVARSLVAEGDEVHVWAPRHLTRPLPDDDGVNVHALSPGFGLAGVIELARSFRRYRAESRVLLQYVPQAFGLRAMNLPLCGWLAALRDTEVWVMFHEAFVLWDAKAPMRMAVLSLATRTMAAVAATRADRVFVSIPSWETLLRSVVPWLGPTTWLPIPSSVATEVPDGAAITVRTKLGLTGKPVVGHFGTYGSLVVPLLESAVVPLLEQHPGVMLLLLGRGSVDYARLLRTRVRWPERILAPGDLDGSAVAAHLAACDVLVQPYADGVSSRRTSTMAGLALGVPIVTNAAQATETVWREHGAVLLAANQDRIAEAAASMLFDTARAAEVGRRGRRLYEDRFALSNTIRVLRGATAADGR